MFVALAITTSTISGTQARWPRVFESERTSRLVNFLSTLPNENDVQLVDTATVTLLCATISKPEEYLFASSLTSINQHKPTRVIRHGPNVEHRLNLSLVVALSRNTSFMPGLQHDIQAQRYHHRNHHRQVVVHLILERS